MVESSARRTGHRRVRRGLQFREGGPLDALVVLLFFLVVEGRAGPLRAATDGSKSGGGGGHLFGRGGVGHDARGFDGAAVAARGAAARGGGAAGAAVRAAAPELLTSQKSAIKWGSGAHPSARAGAVNSRLPEACRRRIERGSSS